MRLKQISHILFALLGGVLTMLTLLIILSAAKSNLHVYAAGRSTDTMLDISLSHEFDNATDVYSTFLPIIFNPPGRLYGYITEYGTPAANITVTLEFCKLYRYAPQPQFPPYCAEKDIYYAATNSDGTYQFINMPTLVVTGEVGMTQTYRVEWSNSKGISNRLSGWKSRLVDSYAFGDQVNVGSFDIGNVTLIQPAPGATIASFPVTFTWLHRPGVSLDNYDFCLWGGMEVYPVLLYDSIGCGQPIGNKVSFEISSPFNGIDYGEDYWWHIGVFDATGGHGISHQNHIQFTSP